MTQALTSYDRYRADFRAFEDSLPGNGPAWLDELRKQGITSFDRLGFPTATRGNERWKYSNVTPIAKATFEYPFEVGTNGVSATDIKDLAPWNEDWARLVFVDGFFSSDLSTGQQGLNGLRTANLADTISADGGLVAQHLGHYALPEDDGFTAVNTAFLKDGAFVHVPDGTSPGPPLHLVFVTTDDPQPKVSYPRTLIVVGRGSRLTVVESYVSLGETPYFTDAVAEIVAEEGAEIEHYRYLMESPSAFHIGTTRVHLGRDSTFSSTSFARGHASQGTTLTFSSTRQASPAS